MVNGVYKPTISQLPSGKRLLNYGLYSWALCSPTFTCAVWGHPAESVSRRGRITRSTSVFGPSMAVGWLNPSMVIHVHEISTISQKKTAIHQVLKMPKKNHCQRTNYPIESFLGSPSRTRPNFPLCHCCSISRWPEPRRNMPLDAPQSTKKKLEGQSLAIYRGVSVQRGQVSCGVEVHSNP